MDPIQYDRITSSLASLRDWPGAFRTAGREHKARAGRARTAISAGEAYLDAAACAHMHAILSAADALGEPAVVLLGSPQYYAGSASASPVSTVSSPR